MIYVAGMLDRHSGAIPRKLATLRPRNDGLQLQHNVLNPLAIEGTWHLWERKRELLLPAVDLEIGEIDSAVVRAEAVDLELGSDHGSPPEGILPEDGFIDFEFLSVKPHGVIGDIAGAVVRIICLEVMPCILRPGAGIAVSAILGGMARSGIRVAASIYGVGPMLVVAIAHYTKHHGLLIGHGLISIELKIADVTG